MNKTVKSTTALRPTYKPTLQNRNGSQTGPKTPKKVTAAHHPSRLVVRFLPNGVREEDKKKPEDLVHDINEAIASVYPLHPEYGGEPEKEEGKEGPRVVAAKYTDRNTSLILTVREDQSGEDLLKYFNFFKDHIIRDDSDYRLEAYSDKKWFKVQVDNVITIDTLGDVLNPNALLGELIQNNPIVQKLYESGHLTMKPRWTRPTEDLLQQERKRSSFVFVTDVEDAAIRIVRSGSLAIAGGLATPRKTAKTNKCAENAAEMSTQRTSTAKTAQTVQLKGRAREWTPWRSPIVIMLSAVLIVIEQA
uniref:Uncharacterized protein n=1 Tax=Moniliophthora roreri TaxID=221103 RepID=A0A0W0EYD4_MONRR